MIQNNKTNLLIMDANNAIIDRVGPYNYKNKIITEIEGYAICDQKLQ